MANTVEEQKEVIRKPKFRDPGTMTYEELYDPGYHLKQLAKLNGSRLDVTCSRCHHCRG